MNWIDCGLTKAPNYRPLFTRWSTSGSEPRKVLYIAGLLEDDGSFIRLDGEAFVPEGFEMTHWQEFRGPK